MTTRAPVRQPQGTWPGQAAAAPVTRTTRPATENSGSVIARNRLPVIALVHYDPKNSWCGFCRDLTAPIFRIRGFEDDRELPGAERLYNRIPTDRAVAPRSAGRARGGLALVRIDAVGLPGAASAIRLPSSGQEISAHARSMKRITDGGHLEVDDGEPGWVRCPPTQIRLSSL